MGFRTRRYAAITARFPGRSHLTHEELYACHFSDCSKDAVMECLAIVEEELLIPVGLLRPDDTWASVLAPVRTFNPLDWLRHRSIESDHAAELGARWGDRRRSDGLPIVRPTTFGEFVRAWCSGA
jgi:hypothetical protein